METHEFSGWTGSVPRLALNLLLVAAAMALCGGRLVAAGGVLDGKTFVGETGEVGKTKGEAEEIDFRDGTFHSKPCDAYGFGRAPYTAVTSEGVTRFEALTTSAKEGRMSWRGTVSGNRLDGIVVWSKAGQRDIEYWVKAKLRR
jgi:hypothetical protein